VLNVNEKPQISSEGYIYSLLHHLNINVLLSNVAFYDSSVFDPSPLTLTAVFLHLYKFAVLLLVLTMLLFCSSRGAEI